MGSLTRAFALLLVCALAATGCSAGGGGAGGSTPEEVANKVKVAAETKDFKVFAECLHPDDRVMMTYGMSMAASMMAAMGAMAPEFKETADKIQACLDKHSVKPPEDMMAAMSTEPSLDDAKKACGHVDHVAFLDELMTIMDQMETPGGGGKESPTEQFEGEIADIKINGDSATGKVGQNEVQFKKHEGRWFMVLPK